MSTSSTLATVNQTDSATMPPAARHGREAAADMELWPPAGVVEARDIGPVTARLGRLFDVLVSLLLLVAVLPLMLAVALLIRWDGDGPVLYRQERLGLAGRPFVILKFRTMRPDAEAAGPSWARVGDPRVTRIGRYLRLSRIDELPQLWNVLRGDMALIGPRPERAHFTDHLSAHIPLFRSRLLVKPGVTGWAQVNHAYGVSIEDARAKLAYDLYYIRNRGPWMTMRILLSTARVMVFMSGR